MKKLLLLYFATAVGTANAADRWWEIRLARQPDGYEHMTTKELDDGAIRTTDEQIVILNRLGSRIELRTKVESVESASGDLMSVREEMTQSEQTVVTEAEVRTSEIQLRTTAGSQSYTRSISLQGPVCGPAAFARMTRDQLK